MRFLQQRDSRTRGASGASSMRVHSARSTGGLLRGRLLWLCGVIAVCLAAAPALAADVALQVLQSTANPQDSGNAFQYEINYTCSPGAANDSQCTGMQITIPLGQAVGNPPGTTVADWQRELLGLPSGASSQLVGTDLVITMPDLPANGASTTFALRITPTRYVTPDNTQWTIQASASGSNFAPVQSNTVDSTVTARANLSTSKRASPTVVMVGNEVTYSLTVFCGSSVSVSHTLDLEHFRLSDTLSEYLTFVSATPSGFTYDSNTREIVWDTATTGAPFPSGCSRSNTNSSGVYTIIARANHPDDNPPQGPVAPNATPVNNTATFTSTPIQQTETSDTRSARITLYQDPPPVGSITSKISTGALRDRNPSLTYAGKWLNQESLTLSGSDSAEATFRPSIRSLPEGYSSELIDSLPCLDNRTVSADGAHVVYIPNAVPDGTSDPLDSICTRPALHTYRLNVTPRYDTSDQNSGPRAAYDQGWRPEVILVDGTVLPLDLEQETSSTMIFRVPDPARERVALVRLPHSTLITNVSLYLATYADDSINDEISLQGPILDAQLTNWSYARAYWADETEARAHIRAVANVFVVPIEVRVGAAKTIRNVDNPRPHVQTNLRMDVASPVAIEHDLVMADLLPEGLLWMDYGPTTRLRITNGADFDKTVELPIEIIQNYQGSGRSLLRVVIPAIDPGTSGPMFPGPGRYSIRPNHPNPGPAGFNIAANNYGAEYVDPNRAGTYENELYAYSLSPDASRSSCADIITASNQFQPEDLRNLSGNGIDTPGCMDSYEFVRQVSGPAGFSTYKQVQGNRDAVMRPVGTEGQVTTPDSTATWTLRWVNEGGTPLRNVVMYDILPHVGDSNVMGDTPRNSEFQVNFVELVLPLPTGVQVQYSASNNPCRPEVYDAPGCVNDWAATPDEVGGAAAVRALRITTPNDQDYASGSEVRVSFRTESVNVQPDQRALNSAASRASVASGAPMLPAESQEATVRGLDKTKYRYGKSVDKLDAEPGDTLVYSITVENLGPGDIVNLSVKDILAADTVFVSASDGGRHDGSASGGEVEWTVSLDEGEVKVLQVTATVSATVQVPSSLTNRLQVAPPLPPEGFEPPDVLNPCEDNPQESCATTHVPPRPELALSKRVADASGDGTAQPGEQLTYTIVVTNNSATDATDVAITDDPDDNTTFVSASHGGVQGTGGSDWVNWSGLTVPAGGTLALTVVFTVNDPLPVDTTDLVNLAIETGATPPDCAATSLPDNCAQIPVGEPQPPRLSLTKTVNTAQATPGGTLEYTVTVSNPGPAALTDVRLTDTPPTGIASFDAWTCSASGGAVCPVANGSGPIDQTVASLPANGSLVYTITATVADNPPETIVNVANAAPPTAVTCVPQDTPSPCTAEATATTPPPQPRLSLTKTVNSAQAMPGGALEYAVTVSNPGPVALTDVRITDTPPAGIERFDAWTCSASGGAVCPAVSGSGPIDQTVANLPVDGSLVYTITATVANTPPETIVNVADAAPPTAVTCVPQGTPSPCSAEATATTPPPQPRLSLTKTANTTQATPGGTLEYTVTVSNPGPVALSDVRITDTPPAGIASFVAWTCSASGGAACPAASGSGAIDQTATLLPVNGGLVYVITATVADNPPETIVNIANATPPTAATCMPQGSPSPCTAEATVTTPPPQPRLSLTKTVNTTQAMPGDTLEYTVTVSNPGPVALTDVRITDTPPAGIASFDAWACSASGGAVCPAASGSGPIDQTVASLPIDGSLIYTITATVADDPPETIDNVANATPPTAVSCVPQDTPSPCSAGATVAISTPQARLSLTKTVNTAQAAPGGTLVYTVTASNPGPVALTDVRVSDIPPAGIDRFDTWSCSAGGGAVCPVASGSGPIDQTVANLPVGGSLAYTITAIVADNPPDVIVNVADATPSAPVTCMPQDSPSPCPAQATVTIDAPQPAGPKPVPLNSLWALVLLAGVLLGAVSRTSLARRH